MRAISISLLTTAIVGWFISLIVATGIAIYKNQNQLDFGHLEAKALQVKQYS
ncbi:hypothetical protein [Zooshikella harenae]|uniref:Uncharacterized protein n=1 Tax=Zooshikella harenae TaxID=2827238 RepID=A0ABS5ZK29_9GAMM|nr:hypothetical protein [Zooshikella harenae]MBU2714168.1 hypothetical protein [Zooshikella harenae]